MKDKLGGKISTEFMVLRPKTYSYLIDDGGGDRKAKETKKSERKQRLKFEDYTKCIQNNKTISRSQQSFKRETYIVFNNVVDKIALSSNDGHRLQTFDGLPPYLYGGNAGKVFKTELLQFLNLEWLILIIMQIITDHL